MASPGRHIDRPVWNPEFTWGTVLTLAVVIAGGVGVWVTLNVRIAEASIRIDSVEERIGRTEGRLEHRLTRIEQKLDRLIERE